MKILYQLAYYFPWKRQAVVEGAVKKLVVDHSESLRKLELYDKGEIEPTKDMVNSRNLQDYVRTISSKRDRWQSGSCSS